jgi:hypothetical protein
VSPPPGSGRVPPAVERQLHSHDSCPPWQVVLDPAALAPALRFCRLTAAVLLRHINPDPTQPVSLPLPAEVPPDFALMPEFVVQVRSPQQASPFLITGALRTRIQGDKVLLSRDLMERLGRT